MSIKSSITFEYPLYVILALMDGGPHLWTFETAQDVSVFMWGRQFSRYAIFKNRRLFRSDLLTGDVKELEKLLEEFDPAA